MAEFSAEVILEDPNFKVLASPDTDAEDFVRLVEKHVPGYTQRKRAVEGLKHLIAKLEAIENKLIVAKAVGKSKGKLDDVEQHLYHIYSIASLREKLQTLNNHIQASLEEGKITAEEQPVVLEQLKTRLEKAKADGKAKLQEKLERAVAAVSAATPAPVPVTGIEEILAMQRKVELLKEWSKQSKSSLTEEQREQLQEKGAAEEEAAKVEESGRMWFETTKEYQPRLKHALVKEAEAQEEAARLERIRLEEEKRLAAQRKEEERWKEVQAKLDRKRELAKQAPQKAAPQPKKKEKKKVVRLDNKYLFGQEDDTANEQNGEEYNDEGELEEDGADSGGADGDEVHPEAEALDKAEPEAAEDKQQDLPLPVEEANSKAKAEDKAEKATSGSTKDKPGTKAATSAAAKPKAKAPAWGAKPVAETAEVEDEELPALGPSLAKAAATAPPKKGSAAPKKAGKAKFTKMSLDALGFEYSDAGQPGTRPGGGLSEQKSAWGQPE